MSSSTLPLFFKVLGLILIITNHSSHVANARKAIAPSPRQRVSTLVDVVCQSYGVLEEYRARCTKEMLSDPKISSEKDSGKLRIMLVDLAIKKAKEARISLEKMEKTNNKYLEALERCAGFLNDAVLQFDSALDSLKNPNPEEDLMSISMNVTIAGDQLDYCEIGLANDHIVDHTVKSIIDNVRMHQRMVSRAFSL
ncbi:hypothetical protein HN51_056306 [Arachis hypogaea]|uniref:uncharacterized protein LOC110267339 n=1 Tax=Arachis ipaensis TaxID=130454 RepID=UPI000A2B805E|nr:uncharacterized protein LOC110267339 [Arachis ipaensis]